MKTCKETLFTDCIYNGVVLHSRMRPVKHKFRYNVFYIHFDLIKANETFQKIPLLSINKFNLFSFYLKDYGPPGCKNLKDWIIKILKTEKIDEKIESIFVLTHPRFLGYVFNPLSVYTCLNRNKKVIAQIYEVHNTFHQRYFYVTKNTFNKKNHKIKIKKEFHVSPFMSITGNYVFKSYLSKDRIALNIQYDGDHGDLLATFNGDKKVLNTKTLLANAMKKPFMTFKVILGIHLEAIFLFVKGLSFFKCPTDKPKY